MQYSAKAPIIINSTLTNADTWYKVTDQVRGVRKWKVKAREATYNAFDYAFKDSPSAYMTNDGAGFSADGCDLPEVWCRSSEAGTVIEIEYWG